MPKIKTIRTRKSPPGWDLIEPTILEIGNQIRDIENQPYSDKKKPEQFWGIFKLHHQRTRYIYEMFYLKKEISRELYEFCLEEKYADAMLIAKWKKTGYERLCCLHCVSNSQHNFSNYELYYQMAHAYAESLKQSLRKVNQCSANNADVEGVHPEIEFIFSKIEYDTSVDCFPQCLELILNCSSYSSNIVFVPEITYDNLCQCNLFTRIQIQDIIWNLFENILNFSSMNFSYLCQPQNHYIAAQYHPIHLFMAYQYWNQGLTQSMPKPNPVLSLNVKVEDVQDFHTQSQAAESAHQVDNQTSQKQKSIVKVSKKRTKRTYKSGHWTPKEHQAYLDFIETFREIMSISEMKKANRIFKQMSAAIKTRSPSQCRSHHQKFDPLMIQLQKINL